jgi:hypothetical protein
MNEIEVVETAAHRGIAIAQPNERGWRRCSEQDTISVTLNRPDFASKPLLCPGCSALQNLRLDPRDPLVQELRGRISDVDRARFEIEPNAMRKERSGISCQPMTRDRIRRRFPVET